MNSARRLVVFLGLLGCASGAVLLPGRQRLTVSGTDTSARREVTQQPHDVTQPASVPDGPGSLSASLKNVTPSLPPQHNRRSSAPKISPVDEHLAHKAALPPKPSRNRRQSPLKAARTKVSESDTVRRGGAPFFLRQQRQQRNRRGRDGNVAEDDEKVVSSGRGQRAEYRVSVEEDLLRFLRRRFEENRPRRQRRQLQQQQQQQGNSALQRPLTGQPLSDGGDRGESGAVLTDPVSSRVSSETLARQEHKDTDTTASSQRPSTTAQQRRLSDQQLNDGGDRSESGDVLTNPVSSRVSSRTPPPLQQRKDSVYAIAPQRPSPTVQRQLLPDQQSSDGGDHSKNGDVLTDPVSSQMSSKTVARQQQHTDVDYAPVPQRPSLIAVQQRSLTDQQLSGEEDSSESGDVLPNPVSAQMPSKPLARQEQKTVDYAAASQRPSSSSSSTAQQRPLTDQQLNDLGDRGEGVVVLTNPVSTRVSSKPLARQQLKVSDTTVPQQPSSSTSQLHQSHDDESGKSGGATRPASTQHRPAETARNVHPRREREKNRRVVDLLTASLDARERLLNLMTDQELLQVLNELVDARQRATRTAAATLDIADTCCLL